MAQFKLGSNIGEILLDIASENIRKGKIEDTILTYKESLQNFLEDLIKKILKNECVLKTSEDGLTLELSYNEDDINNNLSHIRNWPMVFSEDVKELKEIVSFINEIKKNLSNKDVKANDVNIRHFGTVCRDTIDVGAKLLAGSKLFELELEEEDIWEELYYNYSTDQASPEESALYEIVRYVKLIRDLHTKYVQTYNFYEALKHFELINKHEFIEIVWEDCLNLLTEFCDTSKGYYHPLCDELIFELKEKIFEDIVKTEAGRIYQICRVLPKNPTDHYDAAWISPEGEFYGAIGETNQMLHYNLAELLAEKKLKYEVRNSGEKAEQYLCDHSWIKLHGNEAYVYLAHRKKDAKETEALYVPTNEQIEALCTYIDKFHNGKFYTEFKGIGDRISHPNPYSTRDVKQMDEIALHNTFKL